MINLFKTKQVRDAIEARPDDVQAIINGSEYGICITNPQAEFAFVNDRYLEYYGYEREELIGHHFSVVVPDEQKQLLNQLHDDFIQDQKEISRIWEVKIKSGKIMRINVDARFTDKINDTPHKITFVEPQE